MIGVEIWVYLWVEIGLPMDMSAYGVRLFEELTNCSSAKEPAKSSFTLGDSRYVEVKAFIDRFMLAWTSEPEFTVTIPLAPATLQTIYQKRFCTYAEYEKLFSPAVMGNYDAPVFIMLGIANEDTRKTFAHRCSRDLDGYFRLMKALNPSLESFFFPAIHA